MKILPAVFSNLFGLALMAGSSWASAHSWDSYVNVRYAYQICYPKDLLTPQPEADNSDGRAFKSPSGAQLEVLGYHMLGENLHDYTENAANIFAGASGTVTYRRQGKTWSVFSGRNRDMIFYVKLILNGETLRSFALTYPVREAETYDAIAEKLSSCFHALPASM
jgi:hypothetical protein